MSRVLMSLSERRPLNTTAGFYTPPHASFHHIVSVRAALVKCWLLTCFKFFKHQGNTNTHLITSESDTEESFSSLPNPAHNMF